MKKRKGKRAATGPALYSEDIGMEGVKRLRNDSVQTSAGAFSLPMTKAEKRRRKERMVGTSFM